MKHAIIFAALAFALSACGDKAEDTTEEPEAPAPAAATESEAEPEPPIPDSDLPVSADFEAEAEAEITTDNYQAELDALAAEIDTEE